MLFSTPTPQKFNSVDPLEVEREIKLLGSYSIKIVKTISVTKDCSECIFKRASLEFCQKLDCGFEDEIAPQYNYAVA